MSTSLNKYLYFNTARREEMGKPKGRSKAVREADARSFIASQKTGEVKEEIFFKIAADQAVVEAEETQVLKVFSDNEHKKPLVGATVVSRDDAGTDISGQTGATIDSSTTISSVAAYNSETKSFQITLNKPLKTTFDIDVFSQEEDYHDDLNPTSGVYIKNTQASVGAMKEGLVLTYPVERFKGFITLGHGRTVQVDGLTETLGRADGFTMVFEPLIGAPESGNTDKPFEHYDYITIIHEAGFQKEIISEISTQINGNRHGDNGFMVVCDPLVEEFMHHKIKYCVPVLSTQ